MITTEYLLAKNLVHVFFYPPTQTYGLFSLYTHTRLFFSSLNSKPKTLSSKLLPIFSGSFLLFLIDNNKGTRVSCGVLPLGCYFVRENRLKKGGCRFRFGPFSLRIVLWSTPRYISFSFLFNSSLTLRLVTIG